MEGGGGGAGAQPGREGRVTGHVAGGERLTVRGRGRQVVVTSIYHLGCQAEVGMAESSAGLELWSKREGRELNLRRQRFIAMHFMERETKRFRTRCKHKPENDEGQIERKNGSWTKKRRWRSTGRGS